MKPGEIVRRRTPVVSSESGKLRAYASVTLQRKVSDEEGRSCRATYRLFVSKGKTDFRVVKTFSEQTEFIVGVEIIGFSKGGSKLAADFWWAGGDYTAHRPVVYDITSDRVLFGELKSQIIGQLPSCDYFEEFIGVTESGEAMIHVPKSLYVDIGCPDQGNWLFNLQTGKVRRKK